MKGFQFNYKTTEIDGVVYLAENLRETHFRNGDPIIEAKTNEHWKYCAKNMISAFCYYDNDSANDKVFGKLYNGHCICDERGLFPVGWEIIDSLPLFERNKHSKLFVSRESLMDLKLWPRECVNNERANYSQYNTSKFNAVPAGLRQVSGIFSKFGDLFRVWLQTDRFVKEIEIETVKFNQIQSSHLGVNFNICNWMFCEDSDFVGTGLSIRCMKSK